MSMYPPFWPSFCSSTWHRRCNAAGDTRHAGGATSPSCRWGQCVGKGSRSGGGFLKNAAQHGGTPVPKRSHFRDGLAVWTKRRMEWGWIKSKVPAEIVNPKSHYPFQVVSSTQLHWIAHSTSFKITHWGDFSPMKQHVSCDQSCHFHIQHDIRIHQKFPAKRAFRCAWLNESSHVSWKHVE